MLSRLSGRLTPVRLPHQEKAHFPMLTAPLEMVTLIKPLQLQNAHVPIFDMPSSKTTSFMLFLLIYHGVYL